MDIYELVVTAPRQMLKSLAAQLDEGHAWAKAKGLDAEALLQERLAPDMFPLATQVKFVCMQARETVWRLEGAAIEAWACGDAFAELQSHIERTLAFLDAVPRDAFADAGTRTIELALATEIVFVMTGEQFVRDWAIPQFHFHAVMSYAILRHVGVDLGKVDYVPHMLAHMRAPA